MFCDGFETAANKYPELARVIARLRQTFVELGGCPGVLRPHDFAAILGVDFNQVTSAFCTLCDTGVMTRYSMQECSVCGTLMTEDDMLGEDGECVSCGRITNFQNIIVYRLAIYPDSKSRPSVQRRKIETMRSHNIEQCRQSDSKPFLYECGNLGDVALQDIQRRLMRQGLCVIRMTGQTPEGAILRSLSKHFGELAATQNDFTGDVKTIQPTEDGVQNSGDTSKDVGLHVDGTQHDRQPPMVAFQFLDDASFGGESIFVDGLAVVTDLGDSEREPMIEALACADAARFVKKGMHYTGPVFWLTELETVACRLRFDNVMTPKRELREAVARLKEVFNEGRYRISFKPRIGDIVLFDNWRYLHARDQVFGHQIRRHRRIWVSHLFPQRQEEMKLGIRGLSVQFRARVQNANHSL